MSPCTGYPPTIRQIGEVVGISSTSVVSYNLGVLQRKGFLARDPEVSRGLRLVEEALAKHEAGRYGICDNCGREIDIARLEAIPYTPLCLSCAEALEYQARI